MSILVTGTVALDTVTTPFGEIREGLGGSATHFSVSASYFTDVHLVAVVGHDFPDEHINFLKSKKIDVAGLAKTDGRTFRWTGKYDYDLNTAHTLKTELGVLATFDPLLPVSYQNLSTIFLANVDPDIQSRVIDQVKHPKLIACDTMNFWIEGKREALLKTLKRVDLLTINESEARLLADEPNLVRAAQKIRNMGPKTIVIKQGEYGALLFQDDKIFSAPGMPLEAIKDPTGAGDSFAGGFMGYIAKHQKTDFATLKQAVICGSVMASFNVQDFSCDHLRHLSADEIRERFGEFKNLAHFEEVSI